MFPTWLRQRGRRRSHALNYHPRLETLEDRLLPSTYTVINTADTGQGSLRQAILDSNGSPDPSNDIQFDIPGGGVQTINLHSALPMITHAVLIDGYSQAGSSPNTLAVGDNAVLTVELNGAGLGPSNGIGLRITAADTTVRGLVLNRFSGLAIQLGIGPDTVEGNFIGTNASGTAALGLGPNASGIRAGLNNTIGGATPAARNVISGFRGGLNFGIGNGSGNVIEGNYIGTNAAGTAAIANDFGILFDIGEHDNTVGGTAPGAGNVISGSLNGGVLIGSLLGAPGVASNNVVEGNYIGTNAAGDAALGNGNGVMIESTGGHDNTIGGTTANARNIISGNNSVGVLLFNIFPSTGASGNVVEGNYIGTNVAGTGAIANRGDGISIGGDVRGNTIGGTATGAGNLISGNLGNGVRIAGGSGSGPTDNIVAGNLIGTDVNGTAALPNGANGVLLLGGATNNTIGGTAVGAGNVISANGMGGVTLSGSSSTANAVQGNLIGTDASGALNLGNGSNGVAVTGGAHDNAVGGTASGAGNVIAYSGNDGVLIDTGTGNAVSQNSIFANVNLGIELLNHGNNDEPAPQLDSAVAGGGVTVVQGTFTGQALTTYTLEFFVADPSGQGQLFLGSLTVTTDDNGVAVFAFTFGAELPLGALLTATATDPANNTSAFSQTVAVTS
jgi:hypothetical protein